MQIMINPSLNKCHVPSECRQSWLFIDAMSVVKDNGLLSSFILYSLELVFLFLPLRLVATQGYGVQSTFLFNWWQKRRYRFMISSKAFVWKGIAEFRIWTWLAYFTFCADNPYSTNPVGFITKLWEHSFTLLIAFIEAWQILKNFMKILVFTAFFIAAHLHYYYSTIVQP